jgi:hypothetical protein
MTVPPYADPGRTRPTPKVDAGRLWTGGVATAVAALIATGLMHLLLVSTPRPVRFFAWFMVLATLIAVLLPFLTGAEPDAKLATAALNAALGITIGSLVSSVARSAVRVARV